MQIGYNNDVDYRGKKFHIQTEDHGENDPRIESQIFHQGQILDTEIVSYAELLEEYDESTANEKVRSLMWATHRGLYKRLASGEYDEQVGLEPKEETPAETDIEDFEPGQDRVPAKAREIEEKGEEAFQQFHENQARKHVSLDELKDHLDDADLGEETSTPEEPSEAEESAERSESEERRREVRDANMQRLKEQSRADGDVGQDAASGLAEDERWEWPETGATAWRGVAESGDDLGLIPLLTPYVEE
jgi:hypothetical protein